MLEVLSTGIYAKENNSYVLAFFGFLSVVGTVVVEVHKDEIADRPSADEFLKEGVLFLSLDDEC
jgi:hypothetical protein